MDTQQTQTSADNGRRAPPYAGTDEAHDSPGEAMHAAMHHLGEVREYAAHFVAAKIDSMKASVRRVGLLIAVGILGLVGAAAFLAAAIVLALVGVANAIGAALGGRVWAGQLIVGFGLVIGVGIVMMLGLRMLNNSWRRQTEKKYEARIQQQRRQYGHDARQRAAARGRAG
ncbi:MAG TPA: hypothetical protein VH370_22960 [Humisphaera sp.]|nr:hypothetical protein [Humisphaera sp.]